MSHAVEFVCGFRVRNLATATQSLNPISESSFSQLERFPETSRGHLSNGIMLCVQRVNLFSRPTLLHSILKLSFKYLQKKNVK